jgi:uncharacterized protein YpmS
MIKNLKWILFIIFVFALSSLACRLGLNPPAEQENQEPVATAMVQESSPVENQTDNSGEPAPLEVHEAELTELIDNELRKRIGDQFSNLQVYLRDGQIQISADMDSQGISAPVRVVMEVSVDPIGRPQLSIISSSIGPFPVPGDLIDEVERLVNQAFREKIQSLAPNMHIDQIVIDRGMMMIYGHSK